MENNTFGDYLKYKLLEKKWSSERLALAISEDGGTVRAWVRGDRVPRLGHQSIKKIADLFFLDLEELESSQVRSLRERKINIRKKSDKTIQDNYLKPLVKLETVDLNIEDNRPDADHGCICGSDNVAKLMISMLNAINNYGKNKRNVQILMTFQSRNSVFYLDEKLRIQWQNIQLDSIKNGFDITHIIRLDPSESKRTYEFVSNSFRFFGGPGEYEPMYSNSQKILSPSYGLLLLPQEGLILFSSQQPDVIDSAIYTRDKEQLKLLKGHYNQMKLQSTCIFKRYKSYEQGDLVEQLTTSDTEPGDRIIVSRRLSEITRPLAWYDKNHRWAQELIEYLKSSAPDNEKIDFSLHIEHRKQRALRIEEHLKKNRYVCRYIYPISCLKNFIENGFTQPSYYFVATEEERIEQIERILDLLRYQYYEIALVEDKIYEEIKPTFCEVQGNNIFLMEFSDERDEEVYQVAKSKWLVARDKVVVRSFQEYLSKIWNSIQEVDKEKYRISEVLKQGIDLLQDKINARDK
jgi:transcriptional regulator with XRE-family HTH domain